MPLDPKTSSATTARPVLTSASTPLSLRRLGHPRSLPPAVTRLLDMVRPLDFRRVDECTRVLEWLEARAGDSVLDVGCGDGFYDCKIARRGARVHAIDASARRVARALRWHPHPNVTYQQMSADVLRFD